MCINCYVLCVLIQVALADLWPGGQAAPDSAGAADAAAAIVNVCCGC